MGVSCNEFFQAAVPGVLLEKYYWCQSEDRSLSIAGIDDACVQKTLQNTAVNDFEDGLEYYAAAENKCKCIITEDKNDFYFSEIEVLNCEGFFNKYLSKKV